MTKLKLQATYIQFLEIELIANKNFNVYVQIKEQLFFQLSSVYVCK